MLRPIRVLFVCYANRCRSPMAVAAFKNLIKQTCLEEEFEVSSAGLCPYTEGESYHPLSVEQWSNIDVKVEGKSRLIEYKDMEYFDYILIMDLSNKTLIEGLDRNRIFANKVHLLRSYSPNASTDAEIPDPVSGGHSKFATTFRIIEESCRGFLATLKPELTEKIKLSDKSKKYQSYDADSLDLDPHSPFFWDHLSRYWWASGSAIGKDVLDCACGKGYGSFILSHNAKSVLGIDLNEISLDLARANFTKANLQFKLNSVFELQCLNKKFDVIVAFEVIEHLQPEKTGDFLSALCGALNYGGVLFLSTPNHDVVKKSGVFIPEFHINNFPATKLASTLSEHFGSVTMLGQYSKRGFFNNLLFSVDFFNLRHVLAKYLRRSKVKVTVAEEQTAPSVKADIISRYLTVCPEAVNLYRFSPNHWRQSGLTVAVCKNPRKTNSG